jgi:CDGSH-type Zn-finger protein
MLLPVFMRDPVAVRISVPECGYWAVMAVQDDSATVIRAYDDGPLLVRGEFRLETQDGRVIDPGRGTVALCRCGRSALKPFCDGRHVQARFRARGDEGPGRPLAAPGLGVSVKGRRGRAVDHDQLTPSGQADQVLG